MKFLFKAESFSDIKRGGYTSNLRFCNRFDKFCTLNDNEQYSKIIYRTAPPLEKFLEIYKNNDTIFVSVPNSKWLFDKINLASDGFTMYNNNKQINSFIPIVTKFNAKQKSEKICIGFYNSEKTKPSAIKYIKEIATNHNVLILGDYIHGIKNTKDNIHFFETITHYCHVPTPEFFETFPQSLLEAISCNKQIIIPKIHRSFIDGLDDIKSCIYYHENINYNKYYDNSDTILSYKNFDEFYRKLFNNNFENFVERGKYKNLYDWCEKEL